MSAKPNPKDAANKPEASQYRWRVPSWFPELVGSHDTLKKFHDELLRCNKAINLIGINTVAHTDLIHIADSIQASMIVKGNCNPSELYDLGSGNGCPGLVFGILYPTIPVKLVEVDSRKAEFLRHAISSCGLKNVTVLEKNVESLGADSVKFAICRGFAAIPKTLLIARKFLANEGRVFHLKGTEWPLEIGEIPTQLCSYFRSGLVQEYSLPLGEFKFSVVVSQKVATIV